MNLLGSTNYDPATVGGVSKATSALLAMTAVDTANLRLAITVPAHGKVRFKLRCAVAGATTCPVVLLGVMNGATVLGRQQPQSTPVTAPAASQVFTLDSEFTVSGLAAGAMNVDAAYAVQVLVAATNIKYGGANTNAGANAWGGFLFEAWDPQPLPVAIAPGAAGGLHINGVNAGTTTFGALTSTGAFSVNGVNAVSQTGDSFARIGAPAGASVSADIAAAKVDTAAIKVKTDFLPSVIAGGAGGVQIAGANAATTYATLTSTGAFTVNGVAAVSQTGDSFARIGAPAGASVSADVAAVKVDTAAVKVKTDFLPSVIAGGAGGVMIADANAATTYATLTVTGALTVNGVAAVSQTGDSFARIGAPVGASISADVAAVKALLPAALVGGRLDVSVGAMAAAVITNAALAANAISDAKVDPDVTIASVTGAVGSVAAAVTLTAAYDAAKTAAQAATALSTATWTNARALLVDHLDADVSSRAAAATALSTATWTGTRAALLDHLDADMSSRAPSATALTNATWTDARAAHLDADISSRLATVAIPANFGALAITALGAVTAGTVGDKTGYALSAAYDGAKTAAQAATALTNATWTDARAINLDNLNDTITSRMASFVYTAPNNAGIAVAAAASAQAATDIAALLGAYVTPDNTGIAAIQAKTDDMNFTVAGKLDVNTLYINGQQVIGTGGVGDRWRSA
jgi:hypothetical protein